MTHSQTSVNETVMRLCVAGVLQCSYINRVAVCCRGVADRNETLCKRVGHGMKNMAGVSHVTLMYESGRMCE